MKQQDLVQATRKTEAIPADENREEMCPTHLMRPFLTDERINTLKNAITRRTRFITVVLDDIYHAHNISAVVRSAEAFGIQDIHVLQVENPFRPNRGVTKGAQQWVTFHRHSSIKGCVKTLKEKGYILMGADPPSKGHPSIPLDGIEPEQPVALVFGREKEGLHEELRNACDRLFHIPMTGLTESFNISVTVGISLYVLRKKLDNIDRDIWELSLEEKAALLDDWSVKSVRRGKDILKEIQSRAGRISSNQSQYERMRPCFKTS